MRWVKRRRDCRPRRRHQGVSTRCSIKTVEALAKGRTGWIGSQAANLMRHSTHLDGRIHYLSHSQMSFS